MGKIITDSVKIRKRGIKKATQDSARPDFPTSFEVLLERASQCLVEPGEKASRQGHVGGGVDTLDQSDTFVDLDGDTELVSVGTDSDVALESDDRLLIHRAVLCVNLLVAGVLLTKGSFRAVDEGCQSNQLLQSDIFLDDHRAPSFCGTAAVGMSHRDYPIILYLLF